MNTPCGRFKGRMNRQRNTEVLRCGEDRIVVGMTVGLARNREGADERALTSVLGRAFEFARSRGGVSERNMRDRNQPSARIATEVGNPAIVGAAVGVREIGVENLGLPQQPDRRIEHGFGHALGLQQVEALLHVHCSVSRATDIALDGLDAFEAGEDPLLLA